MCPVATLAAPWAQMSGKFAGSPTLDPGGGEIVAMPQPNGQTNIRKNFVANQPNSPAQLLARANMQSVSEAYQSLTIEQVEGWKELTEDIVFSNRFGVDYRPNWNNLFSQINNYRLQNAQAIVLDAPPFSTTPLIQFNPSGPIKSVANGNDWDLTFEYQWIVAGDAVAGLPIRGRISRPTSSPVYQIPDNELRMPNSDFSNNFGVTPALASGVLAITSNRLNIEPTDRVAIELFVLTTDYVPSQRIILRNVEVEEP